VTKVVFPAAISIAPTLIYMTSEIASCHESAFTKAKLDENSLEVETACNGIVFGILPLLLILCALPFGKVVFVNVRSAFTMKNMSMLNLTFVESIQLLLISICAFFAMTVYALRRERFVPPDSFEFKLIVFFPSLLLVATLLNLCKQGKQPGDQEPVHEGGESDSSRLSRGSLSNGRAPSRVSSMEERISVGTRKSIWDGGTRGARRGTGAIKSASKRGIGAERASAEEVMGGAQMDEDDDSDVFAISPGFV
jgi:hypothetical protein